MICPSEYLAQWAQNWVAREVIEERTGLTPRLRPESSSVVLQGPGPAPAVVLPCSENCREDLMALLDVLTLATVSE